MSELQQQTQSISGLQWQSTQANNALESKLDHQTYVTRQLQSQLEEQTQAVRGAQ
jgi:hypothetical protein